MSSSVGGRWLVAVVPIIFGLCVVAGCSGKKDAAKDEGPKRPPRKDQPVIDAARREISLGNEENAGDEELTPAQVLFINGDAITVNEILKWVRPQLAAMRKELPPEEYQVKMADLLRAEVRAQAERRVLSQEAQKDMPAGMSERLEQFVDGRIRDIVNEQHGGRESRYREWLRERDITPEEDRERIRRELVVVAYLQRTVGPRVVEPTRREIERFHTEYISTQQKERKRRLLLIDIPHGRTDATGREVSVPVDPADARVRAERALAKLREGADFAEVAKTYSEGINASAGGDWGWVKVDGLRPRWQPAVDALFRLNSGATSEIIETEQALFIVRCGGIEELPIPSFEELQPKLIAAFKQQQYEVMTRELVGDLFSRADVRPSNPGRFLLAVLNAANDAGMAVR